MKMLALAALLLVHPAGDCLGLGQDSTAAATTVQSVLGDGTESSPLRVSGGVVAAHILKNVSPKVPVEVLKEHISGAVVIAIVVNPDGKVVEASVISGPVALRPSYLYAVNQWIYRPFLLNGNPVFARTTVTMHLAFGATP